MAKLTERRELLDSAGITRSLRRMAHELVERHAAELTAGSLVLVGIRTAGVPLAERLARFIGEIAEVDLPPSAPGVDASGRPAVGAIDITLYRDDVFEGLPKPEVGPSQLPGHTVEGKTLVLVDDVLFTGRTIRAALDAVMDYGRPRRVELAVLIDRGHRELPIRPDYVGLTVQSERDESVKVTLTELGAPADRAAVYVRAGLDQKETR